MQHIFARPYFHKATKILYFDEILVPGKTCVPLGSNVWFLSALLSYNRCISLWNKPKYWRRKTALARETDNLLFNHSKTVWNYNITSPRIRTWKHVLPSRVYFSVGMIFMFRPMGKPRKEVAIFIYFYEIVLSDILDYCTTRILSEQSINNYTIVIN